MPRIKPLPDALVHRIPVPVRVERIERELTIARGKKARKTRRKLERSLIHRGAA